MLTEEQNCLLTWSLIIHFEYELFELDFIRQIHENIWLCNQSINQVEPRN